jgi:hypothetical protein
MAQSTGRARQLLTAMTVLLLAFALFAVFAGELMIAGVTALSITFAIYVRETRL